MDFRHVTICIILVIAFACPAYSQGVDCNGNEFLCVTYTSFLVCLDNVTIDNFTQPCASGFYCYNSDEFECSSTGPPTTLRPTTRKPTTRKPTTRKPTTRKPTTSKPTTRKPTTRKPTTRKPTTRKPTTRKPTTRKPTTRKPTTRKPTTRKPTTRKPTTKKPTTQKPSSGVCTSPGTMPDPSSIDCKRFILCIGIQKFMIKLVLTCPADTRYDPLLKICSHKYTCPVPPVPPKCTTVCRIPNLSVPGCSEYYMCVRNVFGQLLPIPYKCPPFTKFDPIKKICSQTYLCLPTPSPSPSPTTPKPKVCTQPGRLPDPAVPNCKGYIFCYFKGKVLMEGRILCPFNFNFNPLTKKCSVYKCPTPTLPEICKRSERIPHHFGPKCKNYIICVATKVGFKRLECSCPGNTMFNPKTQICSAFHRCH